MTPQQKLITDDLLVKRFGFLHEAIAAASALSAAAELGVLAQLDGGVTDVAAVSRECNLDERSARALLSALSGLGLIEASDPDSYRAVMPYLSQVAGILSPWVSLTDVIRRGHPTIDASTAENAGQFYPGVVPFLGAVQAQLAERAADCLYTPGARILDVGAGAAPWSLALAGRDPACHVTAVDLPDVLAVTRRAVGAAGCEDQFDYVGGDVFALDFGKSRYDLIVLGNLCHLFDEGSNKRLLAKLSESLTPAGTLAIMDLLPHERLDGPRWVVLYALGLLLRTSNGQAYPFSAYARWLRAAGYTGIWRKKLMRRAPITLVTAHVKVPEIAA